MKPTNFTPRDWLTKAKIDVMRHPTFCVFAAVLSCGETTLDESIPTACTDGWNIRFNPTFISKLPIQQLRFVVLHEAMHCAFQHLHMWKHLWERNAQLANIAADMFINIALVKADAGAGAGFVTMPTIGVQPDMQYDNMSVKQIFEAMQQGKGKGDGGGDGAGGDGDDGDDAGKGFDSHDWEAAQARSDAERAEIDTAIQRAVRQGESLRLRMRGKGAGGTDGIFGDLLAPQIDWRAVLREFVREIAAGRDESTWRKPNRRYIGDDVYLPSSVSVDIGEVVIGFDTSGSCFGSTEMTAFASEVRALIEETCPSKVHVVYWGDGIEGHQTFDAGQFAVANLRPRGGGGTDGAVLFDYLRKQRINPVCVVQLSDGVVGDWGRSDWPTLWALTTKLRAPYGTTVHINV